ncbi:aminoglycoside phosphotransferase family protein [Legionella pneumophila]|uniref:aminoglycoside phosphotransferase family protein n=1 Tax=Legionella pneumophila TaxID=446 RepID=UPI00048D027C|nr:aminoglycoside phosphotransferase family protein [Legionella pneumophila]RYB40224.1 aminoglycoside phosphotransferase family protein [Legionella pneumophila]RYW28545.1 aminoglycoside phosphotransferase family protein [Legionella pneumophila]HAT1867339.1 aminoglycoside phosphotransferase family protein [Legionella pneumophila]HAT1907466.1 aminoglycoside phosphotransferase family protein [Legionella pneumophila]HAT1916849.1 aminoglycoside phosphotransferase family protein [Legionella pneumoph
MNKNQLKTICKKLNIMLPCASPKRVYGGLLHRMWCVESNGSQFAVKQLNSRIQLTAEVKRQYELTEEIAFQFSQRNIPAVHAIKTENNYLIFSEYEAFLVYPWINAQALDKGAISETLAVKIAAILAKIHHIHLNVPELDSQEFDIHSNEKIISLIDKSVSQNLVFKERLKNNQLLITEINELFQKAIPILQSTSGVSHGDLDQKNVLWDKNDIPFLVDWESARKLNPTYEIINCALDWSGITTPFFNKSLFIKMLKAYASAGVTINNDHLEAAFYGVLGNWINWLVYNIERSFSSDKEQQNIGIEQVLQVLPTIFQVRASISELSPLITQEL